MARLILRGVLALTMATSVGGAAYAQACAPPDSRNQCKAGCVFTTVSAANRIGRFCRRPASVLSSGGKTYACFDAQRRNCILIGNLAGNSCRAGACVGADIAQLRMESVITPASSKTGNKPLTVMMPGPAMQTK